MFEEDEEELELKFGSECEGCVNSRKPRICRGCEFGEFFQEKDPDGLDFIFKD